MMTHHPVMMSFEKSQNSPIFQFLMRNVNNFVIFQVISIITVRQTYLEMLSTL